MSAHAEVTDSLRNAVRRVLLEDWDPHNAARWPEAAAYDAYVEPIALMVVSGASQEQVMDRLHAFEHETMCFPSLGKQRLRRVAQRLLAAR